MLSLEIHTALFCEVFFVMVKAEVDCGSSSMIPIVLKVMTFSSQILSALNISYTWHATHSISLTLIATQEFEDDLCRFLLIRFGAMETLTYSLCRTHLPSLQRPRDSFFARLAPATFCGKAHGKEVHLFEKTFFCCAI